jgi:hypothetical protein
MNKINELAKLPENFKFPQNISGQDSPTIEQSYYFLKEETSDFQFFPNEKYYQSSYILAQIFKMKGLIGYTLHDWKAKYDALITMFNRTKNQKYSQMAEAVTILIKRIK